MEGAKIKASTLRYSIQQIHRSIILQSRFIEQYGVKVPTTLDELKEAAKTIYEKSNFTKLLVLVSTH